MNTEHEEVPAFNDAQKKYFQEQLLKQTGAKAIQIAPELQTTEQRADHARESRDFTALKDLKVRSAFLQKYGINEFSRLHLEHTRAERERKAAEDQQFKLAEARKRNGRH